MRKLNRAIDRFCALHPRFGIPNLMRYVVFINIAFYILNIFAKGTLSFLMLDPAAVFRGEVWRLLTYALLPDGGGFFLLLSLLFYYWMGTALERLWGTAKFNIYYFSGIILTSIGYLLVYLIDRTSYPVCGATYVNTALFFAYAFYNGDAIIHLFYIIPIRMKWLAWIEAGLYVFVICGNLAAGMYGHAALPLIAMLNLFVYFSPAIHRRAQVEKAHHRTDAIQFRKAVREQQKQRGYNHKCTVCGKTDTEYPNLQFRYCSKCKGYHCYCEEHIFNHTHFTE